MTQRNQIYQGVDAHSTYEDDFIIVVLGHFLGFVDNGNCIHTHIYNSTGKGQAEK